MKEGWCAARLAMRIWPWSVRLEECESSLYSQATTKAQLPQLNLSQVQLHSFQGT